MFFRVSASGAAESFAKASLLGASTVMSFAAESVDTISGYWRIAALREESCGRSRSWTTLGVVWANESEKLETRKRRLVVRILGSEEEEKEG